MRREREEEFETMLPPIEPISKRRSSYPSAKKPKRVGGKTRLGEEFVEKLGRNDCCPCGSGRRFKNCHLVKTQSPWKLGDIIIVNDNNDK